MPACNGSGIPRWIWRFDFTTFPTTLIRTRSDGTTVIAALGAWPEASQTEQASNGTWVRRYSLFGAESLTKDEPDLVLFVVSANGVLLHRRTLPQFGELQDLALAADGSIAVANESAITVVNASLAPKWSREILDPGIPKPDRRSGEDPLSEDPFLRWLPSTFHFPKLATAFDRDGNLFAACRWGRARERVRIAFFDRSGAPRASSQLAARQLRLSALVTDEQGGAYLAGSMCGRLEIGGKTLAQSSCGSLVVSLDAQAKPRWVRTYGSADGQQFLSATFRQGRIALGGNFKSVSSDGDLDAQILVLDEHGQSRMNRSFGELFRGAGEQHQSIDAVAVHPSGGWLVAGGFTWSLDIGDHAFATHSLDARPFAAHLDPEGRVLSAYTLPGFEKASATILQVTVLPDGDWTISGPIYGAFAAGIPPFKGSQHGHYVGRICPPAASNKPKNKPVDKRTYVTWQSFELVPESNGIKGTLRLRGDGDLPRKGAEREGWFVGDKPTTLPALLELLDSDGQVLTSVKLLPVIDITSTDLGDGTTTYFVNTRIHCGGGSWCGDVTAPYQVRRGKLEPLRTSERNGPAVPISLSSSIRRGFTIVDAGVGTLRDILDMNDYDWDATNYVRYYFDGKRWKRRSLARKDGAGAYEYDWSKFPVKRPVAE